MPFEDVMTMIFFYLIMSVVSATIILLLVKIVISLVKNPTIKSFFSKKSTIANDIETKVEEIKQVAEDEFSCGTLRLIDVSEETAALLMAIVSDETKTQLSELCFKTIRLVK